MSEILGENELIFLLLRLNLKLCSLYLTFSLPQFYFIRNHWFYEYMTAYCIYFVSRTSSTHQIVFVYQTERHANRVIFLFPVIQLRNSIFTKQRTSITQGIWERILFLKICPFLVQKILEMKPKRFSLAIPASANVNIFSYVQRHG